ncbi:MAG: glycosyltransferase family 4 protein [Opitutaceae bacterium]|nr:glycosyltransferase family 4 protein [Opitutaceae bacterium]
MAEKPLTVAYLFTTFPKTSEAFLQRDVAAMQARGLNLRLYSLWGGGGEFRGLPVHAQLRWWFFVALLWWIPYESARRPGLLWELIVNTLRRRAPSTFNFWENMLGAGFTANFVHRFRCDPPDLVYAAWTGAPATAAWLMWRLTGIPYGTGAHAYDLYEHGGDWWLREKVALAAFVGTSTEMGRCTLLDRGADPARVQLIRRGLDVFPACKPLRAPRRPLRLVGVARLVPKKGVRAQLRIYAALRAAGLDFEARIVGRGHLREELERETAALGLARQVTFTGEVPPAGVWEHLRWADVLLHTGVVAPTGDRDGLPNVIPEAMATGTLVLTSASAATTEAVAHEATGLVADVSRPEEWVAALRRLAEDDALAERLRLAARRWTEENYDAHKNAARLHACFVQAAKTRPPSA